MAGSRKRRKKEKTQFIVFFQPYKTPSESKKKKENKREGAIRVELLEALAVRYRPGASLRALPETRELVEIVDVYTDHSIFLSRLCKGTGQKYFARHLRRMHRFFFVPYKYADFFKASCRYLNRRQCLMFLSVCLLFGCFVQVWAWCLDELYPEIVGKG